MQSISPWLLAGCPSLAWEPTPRRERLAHFWLLLLALLLTGPCLAQTPSAGPVDFKFSQGDLKLLDEANEFDRQLAKKGLVLPDPQVTAYVESVGQRLVGDQPPLERVNFKFRVLRDPMINAFALPNGSIYVNSGLLAILEMKGNWPASWDTKSSTSHAAMPIFSTGACARRQW